MNVTVTLPSAFGVTEAERTLAQFRDLLADAGFDLRRVVPTGSPAGRGVIEATVGETAP